MRPEPAVYQNPVYNHSFPDPFVLKFAGIYYAFSTGRSLDGGVFGMLRSTDLVSWDELPGAMAPLERDHPHFWAPEVTYANGRFYLYYSVGNETVMEIRVAVSKRPDGGYVDAGRALTTEEFAIDPHVVRDDDGSWYMFYATDFLEHTHIGTGVVVDRMLDPYTLEGKPRPVTRAKYDWQVYDPARQEKGGVRWHTVEGPFVLKRKGLYYEMFSGGNWQNISYGVSYAVSDNIQADDEWEQFSDGIRTMPILRTTPDTIVGPGHNSVVKGPNGRDLYCVYHYWSNGERVLAIDRMDFAGGGRLFVVGPTSDSQPAPDQPHSAVGRRGRFPTVPSFLCEITSRDQGRIDLVDNDDSVLFRLEAGGGGLVISQLDGVSEPLSVIAPDGFRSEDPHTIILEIDGRRCLLTIDGRLIDPPMALAHPPTAIAVGPEERLDVLSLILTAGFEDRFEDSFDETSAGLRGWKWVYADPGAISIEAGILTLRNASIERDADAAQFEFAVNFRLAGELGDDPALELKCGHAVALLFSKRQLSYEDGTIDLPTEFDPTSFHQIRSVSDGTTTTIWINGTSLGQISGSKCTGIEILARDAVVELDMVRSTVH